MKTLTDKQKLIKARKLIEKGWCRNVAARDKYRHPVWLDDKRAAKFCAIGACAKAAVDYTLLAPHVPNNLGIAPFNDAQTSKKPILALFDKAIAACNT